MLHAIAETSSVPHVWLLPGDAFYRFVVPIPDASPIWRSLSQWLILAPQEHVGGTTYYFTAEEAAAQKSAEPPTMTPPFTAYVTPPPQVAPGRAAATAGLLGAARPPAGFFASDQLREQILKQQSLMLVHPNPQAYPGERLRGGCRTATWDVEG